MQGLMMDYQLNVPAILRRGDELYGDREIVSRLPDKSWHRYGYAEFASRAKRLAVALRGLGLDDGDRVGTLMWNHHEHLETYVGAPVGGFVTHTLNLRLHPDDNTYIATHAGDRVLVVDKVLWPLASQFVDRVGFEHVIAVGAGETPDGAIDYEELIASADESEFVYRDIDERAAAAMCFTSGTTGLPKGVVYSHRAIAIHALTAAWLLGDQRGRHRAPGRARCSTRTRGASRSRARSSARSRCSPGRTSTRRASSTRSSRSRSRSAPACRRSGWGSSRRSTRTRTGWDLSRMRTMTVGGSAPPRAMIEAFGERHGLHITHGWGMTEMCPIGTISGALGQELGLDGAAAYDKRAQQGPPIPFVEIRRAASGSRRLGRRERWASSRCAARRSRPRTTTSPESADRWTDDGWFRTGDIVTIGPDGYVEVQDRAKDLVKSGGEWISTVALENALMGHPAIAEAAVIAIPDEKWSERPLAVCVLREGASATDDELRAHLAPGFAKFWLPDRYEFVDEIPKTAVGKFRKTALREQFSSAVAAENR